VLNNTYGGNWQLPSRTMDGRMIQFVRSGFKAAPTEHWQELWPVLAAAAFMPPASS